MTDTTQQEREAFEREFEKLAYQCNADNKAKAFLGWQLCRRAAPQEAKSVLAEVVEERRRQDKQWGGPEHDDTHRHSEWGAYIRKQLAGIPSAFDDDKNRARFVKIAALAVAAIESMDRRTTKKEPKS